MSSRSRSPLPGREGPGVGAAEALGGLQQDRLGDAFGVLVHFAVPEADDGHPSLSRTPVQRASASEPCWLPSISTISRASRQARSATKGGIESWRVNFGR